MSAGHIALFRRLSRLYTERLGILDESWLGGRYPLPVVRVLFEIATGGAVTATAIAARLRLDRGYLSRILASLEADGLVVRSRVDTDRRQRALALTKKGERTFAELDRRQSDDVAAILESLPLAARGELLASMQTCARVLGAESDEAATNAARILLRAPGAGDLGWIVHRHGVLYEEYGWGARFEGLVASVVGDFTAHADPKTERCWVAEREGEKLGSIMVTRADRAGRGLGTAKLRLLLVEPSARGTGLGTRLVSEAIGFATRTGYKKMELWTADALRAARRIYERAGFVLVGEKTGTIFGPKTKEQNWALELGSKRHRGRTTGSEDGFGGPV